MVAENSAIWRVSGVFLSTASTSSMKPMSSLTTEGFTATQYALFSSLYALPGRLVASQSGRIVEVAAASADRGGAAGIFNGWFAGVSPETFARAFERSGVSPAALGSGYVLFFVYSCAIGIFGVVLAYFVVRTKKNTGSAEA